MTYSVKEIYYTLQGEGANAGRAAVFCRFAGCNLWTGREEDREKAICRFCDTDFVGVDGPGGGKFATAVDLAAAVAEKWPPVPSLKGIRSIRPLVVCTGGEPLLQLDEAAIDAFHAAGFEVAIETNGTKLPPPGIDWICVSPKIGSELVLKSGNELKLVYPQIGGEPERFAALDFEHFFLQPMDGPVQAHNIQRATEYCLEHPQWRLSLQTHKLIGIR
jgi:7-carboxy-7-deazaguanine synthase (Cx14CxxC type)